MRAARREAAAGHAWSSHEPGHVGRGIKDEPVEGDAEENVRDDERRRPAHEVASFTLGREPRRRDGEREEAEDAEARLDADERGVEAGEEQRRRKEGRA